MLLGDPPSLTTTSVQKMNIKEITNADRLKIKDVLVFLLNKIHDAKRKGFASQLKFAIVDPKGRNPNKSVKKEFMQWLVQKQF